MHPHVSEQPFTRSLGRVTVPEGLALSQMATRFDDPDAFIEAASDPDLLAAVGIEAPTLEGFLMPDTYFFDEPPTERAVVERMVEHFTETYAELLTAHPDAADRDLIEVVTVASLVEEEARVDDERPVIAAVIYNRLEKRIALAFDSTLQFALNKYGQRMLNEDKQVDSPYNTYKYAGLPPGPIASPGLKSIEAAVAPADVPYIFFVSNYDGTHVFTETFEEHQKAVESFRQKRAITRRELRNKAINKKQ